ncbi:MAG: TrmH family RNA methyltransferase [Ilumatobacteraceae bacterium]
MGLIEIADAGDGRLADYRLLVDREARRTNAGDEYFIAEGFVAIDKTIESGHRLRSVLLIPSRVARFEHHLAALDAAGVPVYVVDRDVVADTVGFSVHRGVLASADRRPLATVTDLASRCARVGVLEGLNDPENVGAIARAARALGIDGLVLDRRCTDPYSRRSIRVSMGEILFLPVARSDDLAGVLDELHRHGFESWAMTPAGDDDLWTIRTPGRLAIVVGAEGPGLEHTTLTGCTRRVRIPIESDVDSLNVGQAAAITFAAIRREMN